MSTTQALDTLVRALHAEFQGAARGPRIAELIGTYARGPEDWRPFALSSPTQYTRNLVAREPRFELMVLVWGPGQESAIHNHEGQDCWMAVLDGEIEEVRYPMPVPGVSGPLGQKSAQTFRAGQVAFIRDEMGLHLVRPPLGSRSGGITLHLYSSPYDACNVYCPQTGQVTRKALAHYSVRGQRLTVGT